MEKSKWEELEKYKIKALKYKKKKGIISLFLFLHYKKKYTELGNALIDEVELEFLENLLVNI